MYFVFLQKSLNQSNTFNHGRPQIGIRYVTVPCTFPSGHGSVMAVFLYFGASPEWPENYSNAQKTKQKS